MNKFSYLLVVLLSCISFQVATAQIVSKSFEMRYFTDSLLAFGTIDFKGDSTFFTDENRVEGLQKYIQYSKLYFQDKELDKRAVSKKEMKAALQQIKRRPKPQYRERLFLDDWRFLANKQGLRQQQEAQIVEWTKNKQASVTNGKLYAMNKFEYNKKFELQDGRFTLEWETQIPKTKERSAFLLLDKKSNPVVLMGITAEGGCFYKSQSGLPIDLGQIRNDTLVNFKIFLDTESGRFSLWIDGEEKADFVRALSREPVNKLFLKLPLGATLDNIYGLQYERVQRPDDPQELIPIPKGQVFLDERFEFTKEIGDLGLADFDDSEWQNTKLPVAASDRYRDSDLIFRKTITIPEKKKRSILYIEHLSKSAEIWLNRRILHVQREVGNLELDLTKDLKEKFNNQLMIRLRAGDEGHIGETWLDQTDETYIERADVSTELEQNAARLRINAQLKSVANLPNGEWKGRVTVRVSPWQSNAAPTSQTFPVRLRTYRDFDFSETIILPSPNWWSVDNPNLYQVEIALVNERGRVVDDLNIVTGIRRVSQEGGSFSLNGEPMLLNGVNWTDYVPFPIGSYEYPDDVTEAWLVRVIKSIKALNGNTLRISRSDKVNKDLLARLCDQLGLMLVFQTEDKPQAWATDFEALQETIRYYRHHPSIIIWQGADKLQFSNFTQDASLWMNEYRNAIRSIDTTRLIALTGIQPNFGSSGIPNDKGTRLYDNGRYKMLRTSESWVQPDVIRVGSDPALSFGSTWDNLRSFPVAPMWDTLRLNYLNSDQHIYIDFRSEALAGQENPRTVKGTPYRYSETYKSPYLESLLNVEIPFEDWILSQAWQGFAAYEAYRKKRWLGYDGLLWTALMNGADPSTLLDASGYRKIAAYTVQMAQQATLAGSYTTDVAYCTGEYVPVFVTHTGEAMEAQVTVLVKDVLGEVLQRETLPTVYFPKGNHTLYAGEWTSNVRNKGWYSVEYEVRRK